MVDGPFGGDTRLLPLLVLPLLHYDYTLPIISDVCPLVDLSALLLPLRSSRVCGDGSTSEMLDSEIYIEMEGFYKEEIFSRKCGVLEISRHCIASLTSWTEARHQEVPPAPPHLLEAKFYCTCIAEGSIAIFLCSQSKAKLSNQCV